jgi:beta-glucosidase
VRLRKRFLARPLRYRWAALLACAGMVGASIFAISTSAASARSTYPWLDQSERLATRVHQLMGAMTLAEKVGQMDQQEVTQITDKSNSCTSTGGFNLPNPVCEQMILVDNHTGSILAGGTDIPPDTTNTGTQGNRAIDWANEYNAIQGYALRNTRLRIPVLFGVDAVHGFGHPTEAPLFPQSIGMGATWDPALAQVGGQVTGNATAATGWDWVFAPVQDLARDNRWGRTYETWAEEPTLAAAMGAADVTGMQSVLAADGLKAAATVKHFAGYSESINGHDRVQAEIPLSYLQDLFLPSYGGAIGAGSDAVMVDSGSINGVPATASHYLLTTILRQQLGFNGVVISDYGDVPALQTTYHVAANLPDAIARAVNAGVDMAMEPFNSGAFQAAILSDVANGKISMARINQAVQRILTMKFELGLFDQPCVRNPNTKCIDASNAEAAVTAGRQDTLQAARESITLLQNKLLKNNEPALPLAPTAHVTVTGPSADSMTNQLGGWSVSWQGVFGSGHVCCMGPQGMVPPGTTVKAGIKAEDPNAQYISDAAAAVAAAPSTEAYVVVVGERAYAEGLGDDPSPQIPPDQQAEITALVNTGKPVIVVLIAGRPLGLGSAASAAAILMAYQGSTEAGQAVADAVFGKIDPSGHLPVTWPSDAPAVGGDFNTGAPSPLGDEPKFFDQLPYTGSGPGSGYNPAYPFGYGLSYTTFAVSNLSVTPVASTNGSVTAMFTVKNTGTRAGTEVVPVYVNQPVSNVITPPQRLVGFTRITLDPGQSQTVSVVFPASRLGMSQGDIDTAAPPTVQPGSYVVQIDADSTTPYQVVASAPFTLR